MDIPSDTVLDGLMKQLQQATASVSDTQQRLLGLTGVAWSDDKLVRAEVGPRGQLIDIEIDPQVLRKPNVAALRAAILTASYAAVSDVMRQATDIIDEQVPPEVAELRARFGPGEPSQTEQLAHSDAEIVAQLKARR